LPPGHAEIEIIEDEQGKIRVSATGAENMGTTYPHAAVSHGDDDVQLRPCRFQAQGVGEGPAVETVKGMGVEKDIEKPGTADITNQNNPVSGNSHLLQGLVKSLHYPLMRAARTKNGRPCGIE
jgi:hypothetical protein